MSLLLALLIAIVPSSLNSIGSDQLKNQIVEADAKPVIESDDQAILSSTEEGHCSETQQYNLLHVDDIGMNLFCDKTVMMAYLALCIVQFANYYNDCFVRLHLLRHYKLEKENAALLP